MTVASTPLAPKPWTRIIPYVRTSVRKLAEYGRRFTSDDVWKQLSPALYAYWG